MCNKKVFKQVEPCLLQGVKENMDFHTSCQKPFSEKQDGNGTKLKVVNIVVISLLEGTYFTLLS